MELFLEGYGQEVCRIWKAELYCIVTSTTAMRVLNVCCIRNCVESNLIVLAALLHVRIDDILITDDAVA